MDKKKITAIVLLDMSKAFDSINHGILLNKLQDIGASISALQWFNSYLSNRTQTVRIHLVYILMICPKFHAAAVFSCAGLSKWNHRNQ